ncbi:hypothetical protein BDK88_4038 [Natrinema hispanicum]|uniref:DUF7511 domain-containing protein n=1 Tax=Natrinema hispanicum TaxID=392421 RepID=A0A482Y3K0_9EURY|nr:hypothetical protein BDK88_4038 [Natrinema hispanicum]
MGQRTPNTTAKKRSESRIKRQYLTDHVTDTRFTSSAEHPAPECCAIIESMDSGPNLCTIYSISPEDSLVTAWISAHEGSYCTLEDAR